MVPPVLSQLVRSKPPLLGRALEALGFRPTSCGKFTSDRFCSSSGSHPLHVEANVMPGFERVTHAQPVVEDGVGSDPTTAAWTALKPGVLYANGALRTPFLATRLGRSLLGALRWDAGTHGFPTAARPSSRCTSAVGKPCSWRGSARLLRRDSHDGTRRSGRGASGER